jgi:hypothetical protein
MDDDVDLTQLPPEFPDLIPLIEEWAELDDVVREAKLASASTDDLRRLSAAPRPRFEAINAFLDEHDDQEEAPYMGALAEAAVEAGIELEGRAG